MDILFELHAHTLFVSFSCNEYKRKKTLSLMKGKMELLIEEKLFLKKNMATGRVIVRL